MEGTGCTLIRVTLATPVSYHGLMINYSKKMRLCGLPFYYNVHAMREKERLKKKMFLNTRLGTVDADIA